MYEIQVNWVYTFGIKKYRFNFHRWGEVKENKLLPATWTCHPLGGSDYNKWQLGTFFIHVQAFHEVYVSREI